MKRPRIKINLLPLFLIVYLFSRTSTGYPQNFDYNEAIQIVKKNFTYNWALFHFVQTHHYSPKKKPKTLEYDYVYRDNTCTIYFSRPIRISDLQITFDPQSKVIRHKIGKKFEKVEGFNRFRHVLAQDFTYFDYFLPHMLDFFNPEEYVIVKLRGQECWRVKIVPQSDKKITYQYLNLYLTRRGNILYRIEYFDEKGKHIKTLDFLDYSFTKGHFIPKKIVVRNRLNGNITEAIKVKQVIRKP